VEPLPTLQQHQQHSCTGQLSSAQEGATALALQLCPQPTLIAWLEACVRMQQASRPSTVQQ
jgi:hypothetical protein